jgi:S1-C subfamily serine protease
VEQIVASDQAGNETSLGSGFIVSADGKIVTNYHVIEDAHSAVAKMAIGSFLPVEGALEVDAAKDLALLKVDGKGLPFLNLASTLMLHVGDHVVAIGSQLELILLSIHGTVNDSR